MAVPRKAPGLRPKAPGLHSSVRRFVASLAADAGLATAIALTDTSDLLSLWSLLILLAAWGALAVTVVCWVDLGRALRAVRNPSSLMWFLGIAFGIPQAIFAVGTMTCGFAIVGWVLYNSFIDSLPAHSGGGSVTDLVMGAMAIAFGFGRLRNAFKHSV
jgi:hypothetical protein